VTAYDTLLLATTPEAYWPCDEASGNLTDDSGGGWTATAAGAGTATYQVAGLSINSETQHSIEVDGAKWFTVSSSFPFPTPARTVAAWVYLPGASTAAGSICSRLATNQREWTLRHVSNGQASLVAYADDGNTAIGHAAGDDLDGGAWHHVIGWWSDADQDCYIQVDGGTPVSAAGAAAINPDSTAAVVLAAGASGGDPLRAGSRISKVAIWDRVLTDAERTSLYTGISGTPPAPSPDITEAPDRPYFVVTRRDPLIIAPYVDPDEERFGERAEAKYITIRVASDPLPGFGTLVSRPYRGAGRIDESVPEEERTTTLEWESYYDVAVRYRDNATDILSSTLAASPSAGATVIKYTAGAWAAGQLVTIYDGDETEVRTIATVGTSGAGGTGLTLVDALTYAHASGDSIVAHYWGPLSAWQTFKVSAPPTVLPFAPPSDGATVTDPTVALGHVFISPSGKVQTSWALRIYERTNGIDRLVWEESGTGSGASVDAPTLLLADGRTYAWEKTATDGDGLSGTSARVTFTTNFTQPNAVTNLVATQDTEASATVLTYTLPATFDHIRVYWRDALGTYVRVDGGPETLGDGRTKLIDGTFMHYGARLGLNDYIVTSHNGSTDVDAESVAVLIEAELVPIRTWSSAQLVVAGEWVEEVNADEAPRQVSGLTEVFHPPGRSGAIPITWGLRADELRFRFTVLPEERGVISRLEDAIQTGQAVLVKLVSPYYDPKACSVLSFSDVPSRHGFTEVDVSLIEVE
jgi:hypothetical protein